MAIVDTGALVDARRAHHEAELRTGIQEQSEQIFHTADRLVSYSDFAVVVRWPGDTSPVPEGFEVLAKEAEARRDLKLLQLEWDAQTGTIIAEYEDAQLRITDEDEGPRVDYKRIRRNEFGRPLSTSEPRFTIAQGGYFFAPGSNRADSPVEVEAALVKQADHRIEQLLKVPQLYLGRAFVARRIRTPEPIE